jgi:TrmH RNA methyltransferase
MRNRLTDELAVCGLNAVIAVAEYHPEQINRLFLREDRLASFSKTCKMLAERKRPYKICEDEELERICKSTHHQGVVAMILLPAIDPLSREDLDEWAQEGHAGIVLHSVGNDHNLGAIVRSAAFFDFKYVVIAGREPRPRETRDVIGDDGQDDEHEDEITLSTSAYRIAEGGMEHVTVRSVRNTVGFLRSASRQLVTIGTDIRARQRIGDLSRIVGERQKGASGRPGIALVIGNEETGLPANVKDSCSVLVRIPGTGLMESLNVAQAATLFMQRVFEL